MKRKKYSFSQAYYFFNFIPSHIQRRFWHVDAGLIRMLWNIVSDKGCLQVCCAPLGRGGVMDGAAISISIVAQMDLKDLWVVFFFFSFSYTWQSAVTVQNNTFLLLNGTISWRSACPLPLNPPLTLIPRRPAQLPLSVTVTFTRLQLIPFLCASSIMLRSSRWPRYTQVSPS